MVSLVAAFVLLAIIELFCLARAVLANLQG